MGWDGIMEMGSSNELALPTWSFLSKCSLRCRAGPGIPESYRDPQQLSLAPVSHLTATPMTLHQLQI